MDINNESLGQTAEKVICDLNGIDSSNLLRRSIPQLEIEIRPYLEDACKKLPKIVRHSGLESGNHGGQSKSVVDFYGINNETISVKTTKNSNCKVCPSECGQPGGGTFDRYFRHLYNDPNEKITYDKFKALCLEKSHEMMPVYIEHLFDCDYLLWLYFDKRNKGYKIVEKKSISSFAWLKERFSFTKDIGTWNESCTVKYDGLSIGEYQVHNHRNNYKFRFNLNNLCDVMNL
jgi:hypothetical protein